MDSLSRGISTKQKCIFFFVILFAYLKKYALITVLLPILQDKEQQLSVAMRNSNYLLPSIGLSRKRSMLYVVNRYTAVPFDR